MLDPAIAGFLSERKEAWLKKKITTSMLEYEIKETEQECEQLFSLNEWLPNAAKRASSRSFSTHPSKFSHPSTGVGDKNRKNFTYVTPIICQPKALADGFLKSGCIVVELDSLGNAAELDVDKFLRLTMEDGATLITHIQQDTELAKSLLTIKSENYENLKKGFLAMVASSNESITSSKIKQVYFPVEDDYHQLSLLTNSGIVYELRSRLDKLRFSEEVKILRDKKRNNEFSEQSYGEIYGLTTIGYGGAQPQNISVFNTTNVGKAHLLSSLPPSIEKRNIHFPKSDFFVESFKQYEYSDTFKALHRLFQADHNNINIRDARDRYLQQVLDLIIEKMWAVRAVSQTQYHQDSSSLSSHQKTWLHTDFAQQRENDEQWLDKLVNEISRWLSRCYEKVLGKQAVKLGEEERLFFAKVVEQNREFLK